MKLSSVSFTDNTIKKRNYGNDKTLSETYTNSGRKIRRQTRTVRPEQTDRPLEFHQLEPDERHGKSPGESPAGTGVKSQDRIGQYSQNKAENLLVDYATFSIRGVVVPIYPTSTQQQVDFITKDAAVEILFVDGQKQYEAALEVMKTSTHLKKIIVLEQQVKLADSTHSMYFEDLIEIGMKSKKDDEVEKRRAESVE